MAELGIDIFLAANNHIYDRGLSGAERTLEQYRRLAAQYGTSFVGLASDEGEKEGNMPLILNIKGVKLAFLNFTYATNGGRREGWPKVCYMDERKDIRNAIETARKAKADMIIALPHWGEEYRLTHSAEQEEMAQWLTDQGVNIIIGTHPHVVQDSAVLSSRLDGAETQVIYSLGNAISNMSATNTQLELMASVRIVRHCNGDLELLPVELDFLWCSRPGGFDEGYTVLPIKGYIGRRSLWTNPSDYDNMMNSFRRVAEATGINTTDIKYINE
jgi:poly-gamma-glutamate synthesis protein (capsule biosynthesis protein)